MTQPLPGATVQSNRPMSPAAHETRQPEIMSEPKSTVDGERYEKQAIESWFTSGHITSPLTNLPLSSRHLMPNHTLKRAIANFLEEQPHLQAWEQKVSNLGALYQVCLGT